MTTPTKEAPKLRWHDDGNSFMCEGCGAVVPRTRSDPYPEHTCAPKEAPPVLLTAAMAFDSIAQNEHDAKFGNAFQLDDETVAALQALNSGRTACYDTATHEAVPSLELERLRAENRVARQGMVEARKTYTALRAERDEYRRALQIIDSDSCPPWGAYLEAQKVLAKYPGERNVSNEVKPLTATMCFDLSSTDPIIDAAITAIETSLHTVIPTAELERLRLNDARYRVWRDTWSGSQKMADHFDKTCDDMIAKTEGGK